MVPVPSLCKITVTRQFGRNRRGDLLEVDREKASMLVRRGLAKYGEHSLSDPEDDSISRSDFSYFDESLRDYEVK